MQYLLFGILLIFGAFVIGLSLFVFHSKNRVKAVVLESRCDVKRDEEIIEEIKVTHVLSMSKDGENVNIETELIPVREIKDAEMKLYFDTKSQQIYLPDYEKYYPLLGAFVLCGLLCAVLYAVDEIRPFVELFEIEWIAVLLGAISVAALSYAGKLLNPSVVKVKGNYEGILKQEDGTPISEIYSLWYGKHRQYAKRISGVPLRKKKNPIVLFYNTRKGTVFCLLDVILSVCTGIIALLLMTGVLIM